MSLLLLFSGQAIALQPPADGGAASQQSYPRAPINRQVPRKEYQADLVIDDARSAVDYAEQAQAAIDAAIARADALIQRQQLEAGQKARQEAKQKTDSAATVMRFAPVQAQVLQVVAPGGADFSAAIGKQRRDDEDALMMILLELA